MLTFNRSISVQTKILRLSLLVLSFFLLIQYLHNRSLWNDEAMLSLNILNREVNGLFQPLADHQAAPVLFLLIVKLFTFLFGNSEFALRIFPLFCALVSLPVFYTICFRLTHNRALSICALILLGCTPQFIYYSSEVKQYATDLLVLLIIYYTAFIHSEFLDRWRPVALAIAGALAIFISNISIIVLCTAELLYIYRAWRNKKIRTEYWLPVIIWGCCFIIYYMLFVRNHPSAAYMYEYWKHSFMPIEFWNAPFRKWIDKSIVQIFRDLLPSLPWGYLFAGTFLIYVSGLAMMLWKKEWQLFYLCVAPVIIHLLLSALKIYPFELRLILYQLPLYIIVMTYGIWHLCQALIRHSSIRRLVFISIIALLSVQVFFRFPIVHDEIKPAIYYINQYSQPGESLYVFRGSTPATQYYIKTGLARFDALQIVWGKPRNGGIASYLNDLSEIRGHTWLLLSHMYPYNGSMQEENKIIEALQRRGVLLRRYSGKGSSVYEFELE